MTSASVEAAAVVEQRKASTALDESVVSVVAPAAPVLDGNEAEAITGDDLEAVVDLVEESGDQLHRGTTLLADGRLELCQLSKLLQCVRARDVRMIDNLASKGVPHLLDYAHPDNETVLGLTASRNDDTLLTHLLQLGADPNVADVTGRTAAMRACEYGHLQSMSVLAEAGIDMKLVDDIGQGNAPNPHHHRHHQRHFQCGLLGPRAECKLKCQVTESG